MKRESVILTFLSMYKEKATEEEYIFSNKKYKGIQTNDAPIRCLLDLARENDEPVTKILCIVTKEVYSTPFDDKGTTVFQRFEDLVKNIEPTVKVIPLPYDFSDKENLEKKDAPDRAVAVYQKIAKELKGENNVYVDFTGGMRDAAFFMTTILRYLEFTGAACRQIIYSKYVKGGENQIEDIRYIYDLFQMINGISEFTTTGNVSLLYKNISKYKKSEIGDLIQSIRFFAEAISLCSVDKLDDALNELAKSMRAVYKLKEKDIEAEMLCTMIPKIRKHMHMNRDNTMPYPSLILWCVENQMIQQALTVYTEKMPEYYYKNKMLPDVIQEKYDSCQNSRGVSKEIELFYGKFFDYMINDRESEKFLTDLDELNLDVSVRLFQNKNLGKKLDKMEEWREGIARQLKNVSQDKKQEKIWNRLKSVYDKYQAGEKPFEMSDKISAPNDFLGFVNAVRAGSTLECRYYLIYGDKALESVPREKELGVYMKKVRAIQALDKKEEFSQEEKNEYRKMMQYYLAVKMIRNHVNHADGMEEDSETDFNDVCDYFNNNTDLELRFDFEGVSNLLKQAVSGCISGNEE